MHIRQQYPYVGCTPGGVTNDFIKQQNNLNHQLVTGSNAELEVNSTMEVQNHSEPTITLQPTTLA